MKILDEVITANECCDHGEPDSRCEDCPYNGIGACCAERESDALQWLKGYRAHIELDKLRDKCETENDPLSWDELRQMEGKPIWIEEIGKKYSTPHWEIHHGTADGYDGDEILYLQPFEVFTKNTLGKTWQAYRKQR